MFARHVLGSLESLQAGDHVCAVMETRAEELALIAAWARTGIAKHERCVYVAKAVPDADLREALSPGVDIVEIDEQERSAPFDIDLALAWWLHQIEIATRVRSRASTRSRAI